MYGSISCHEPGKLPRLLNDLPNAIRKVIIVSQRFDSQLLSRWNISSYSLPGSSIQELTIMDCGLRSIGAGTFRGLSNLMKLDVSRNSLTHIHGHTFSGLRLNFPRLDDNQGLSLDAEAFANLSVSSLSMQNWSLRSLSYDSKIIYSVSTESGIPIPESSAPRPMDVIKNESWDQAMEKQRLISKSEGSDPNRIFESRPGNDIYSKCPTYDLLLKHTTTSNPTRSTTAISYPNNNVPIWSTYFLSTNSFLQPYNNINYRCY